MSKTLAVSAAALTLCALISGGCQRAAETTQAEPPLDSAATASSDTETAAPSETAASGAGDLTQVRQAVRDFVKEKYPDAKVNGVWTLLLRENYAIAGADTLSGSRHRTIDVLVRLYVKENGTEYWRAEGWGPDMAKLLLPRPSAADADQTGVGN